VVAEFELDSVIPPPDTIEEDKEIRFLRVNSSREEPSHVKINSKRELSRAKHPTEKALKSSALVRQSTNYATLIARFQD
jgi:hypothetical protein